MRASVAWLSPPTMARTTPAVRSAATVARAWSLLGHPALALDFALFAMVDARSRHAQYGTSIHARPPMDPAVGELPASRARDHLAEAREELDAGWTESACEVERFEAFRALEDEAKAGWLAWAVATSLEAKPTYAARQNPLQNRLATIMAVGHEIFAIVCLVRWNPRDRESLIFGYKDMDETCGPNEAACPPQILALLSPTDSLYARALRDRCRVNAARARRRLEPGMRIRLAQPVTFTDGYSGDEFVVDRLGRRTVFRSPAGGGPYRISGIATRDWTPIHETRVHGTVFA